MKLIVLACLAAVAVAAPQFDINERYPIIQVLRDERTDNGDGNFQYLFETENGINTEVRGAPNAVGASVMQGSFSFPLPDGTIAVVTFVADEGGYRPESPIIPAMPAHAIEQVRFAEEQRARGVQWNEQGFVI